MGPGKNLEPVASKPDSFAFGPAHVLKNDDRHAAEQAASFLIGAGWDPESHDKQG